LFGHELIGIDLSDESAETVTHLWQLNLQPKPDAGIPMIALIPYGAHGNAAVRGLVLVVKTRAAEKPVKPDRGRTHGFIQSRLHAIDPGRTLRLIAAELAGVSQGKRGLDRHRQSADPL